MKTLRPLAASFLVFVCGCGGSEKSQSSAAHQPEMSENPIEAPAEYIGVLGKAEQQAVRTADLATLTKAIQIFEAQEDRYPRDLKELVEKEYLAKLPVLPPGTVFSYDPKTGAVRTAPKPPGP